MVEYLFEYLLKLSAEELRKDYAKKEQPKKYEDVAKKKREFYAKVVPAIEEVYAQEQQRYEQIQKDINTTTNTEEIEALKKLYKVESDTALLKALKPHPKSIAIAQAAIESAWGTSRFFKEANNIFGMWSASSKDERIAAGEKRGERTIWLKKFPSLKESVRAYYLTLSRAKQYEKFRDLNYATDDVFTIIEGLENYSEKKQEYVDTIKKVIEYNDLLKYDN